MIYSFEFTEQNTFFRKCLNTNILYNIADTKINYLFIMYTVADLQTFFGEGWEGPEK